MSLMLLRHLPPGPASTRVLGLALAALSLAGCEVGLGSEGYTVREEKRFSVSGTPDVRLVTFDGSIEVRPWDRSEVVVEIVKQGGTREAVDAIEIVAEQSNGIIQVEARRPLASDPFLGMRRSRGARMIASIPRRSDVRVRTGDGAITIEGIEGRLELRTGDGSIRGLNLGGEITANTGDGTVRLEDIDGRVELTTGDGGISVDGKLRGARIRTGDGSITLRAIPGSAMSDAWDVTTGDGGVALYLPSGFNGDLDAETDDGVIRSEMGIEVPGGSDHERRRIRGKMGAGGPPLRIRTADGSIRIHSS
jgi:hypothetical protein